MKKLVNRMKKIKRKILQKTLSMAKMIIQRNEEENQKQLYHNLPSKASQRRKLELSLANLCILCYWWTFHMDSLIHSITLTMDTFHLHHLISWLNTCRDILISSLMVFLHLLLSWETGRCISHIKCQLDLMVKEMESSLLLIIDYYIQWHHLQPQEQFVI